MSVVLRHARSLRSECRDAISAAEEETRETYIARASRWRTCPARRSCAGRRLPERATAALGGAAEGTKDVRGLSAGAGVSSNLSGALNRFLCGVRRETAAFAREAFCLDNGGLRGAFAAHFVLFGGASHRESPPTSCARSPTQRSEHDVGVAEFHERRAFRRATQRFGEDQAPAGCAAASPRAKPHGEANIYRAGATVTRRQRQICGKLSP